MVRVSTVAAAAFVVISVMKTLVRGLVRERQGRDVRGSGRSAGHDVLGELQREIFVRNKLVSGKRRG